MGISEQSKSVRYGNSEGNEIGVKFNRNLEVIIMVEDSKSKVEFTFYREDDQTLDYFENIFTNFYSYLISFDTNYGRKVNESSTSLEFALRNKAGVRMIISVIVDDVAYLSFKMLKGIDPVEFVFTQEDKQILEMFRKDLSEAIKNKGVKLPPVSITSTRKEN